MDEDNRQQKEPAREVAPGNEGNGGGNEKVYAKHESESEETTNSTEFLSILQANAAVLGKVHELLQNRFEYDATKEKAFDKLYEEMKKAKEMPDMLDRVIKPVLTDLVLLYDSIRKIEAKLNNNPSLNNEDFLRDVEHLREELIEVLYRQEVVPVDESLSVTFNAKQQKAIKAEETPNPDEHMRVKRIVRSGFFWRDRVLRPQEVIVSKHNQTKTTIETEGAR